MKRTDFTWCGIADRMPRVAMVLISGTSPEGDPLALELLERMEDWGWPDREIFLVDRTDRQVLTDAALGAYPDIFVFKGTPENEESADMGVGLSAVLKHGGFDYVWVLSAGVMPQPGALEVLVELLEARPDAAVAGGSMLLAGADSEADVGGDFDVYAGMCLGAMASPFRPGPRDVLEVDYIAPGSCLVRCSAMRETGLPDRIGRVGMSVDWCARFRRRGYAVVATPASRSLLGASAQTELTVRDACYLRHKYTMLGRTEYLGVLASEKWRDIRAAFRCEDEKVRMRKESLRDFLLGRYACTAAVNTVDIRQAYAQVSGTGAATGGTQGERARMSIWARAGRACWRGWGWMRMMMPYIRFCLRFEQLRGCAAVLVGDAAADTEDSRDDSASAPVPPE